MHPYDKVTKNGRTIGISTWVGYRANEVQMLTLASLRAAMRPSATSCCTFVWGEENGGTPSPRRAPRTKLNGATQSGALPLCGTHRVRRRRFRVGNNKSDQPYTRRPRAW